MIKKINQSNKSKIWLKKKTETIGSDITMHESQV
jgi:hypothetical protein